MTRSLRSRVLMAMMLVAVASSALSAALAWTYARNTQVVAEKDRAVEQLATQRLVLDHLMAVGVTSTTWVGLDQAVQDAAADVGARVVVSDVVSGVILADSDAASSDRDPANPVVWSGDVDVIVNPAFAMVAPVGLDGNIAELSIRDCGDRCFEQIDGFSPPVDVAVELELSSSGPGFDAIGTALAIAGIVLGSVLLAAFIAHRVARPIAALSASATKFGSGDRSERFAPGKSSTEVTDLAGAFNSMADNLERSESARAALIADTAHELRNPVGTILGNLEAAQDGVFEMDAALVDRLHVEATHLSRLTEDLQQLALADAGALTIAPEEVDLGQLITDVVGIYAPLAAEVGVALHAEVAGPLEALIDPTRIRQVVGNLVKNAMTYTPCAGSVRVQAESADNTVLIRVEDTGVGLSVDDQQRVFDRFWRADESRTRASGGTGVGLAICTSLVEAHHGTLTVTSEPGIGSCFTVAIPQHPVSVSFPSPEGSAMLYKDRD